MSKQVRLGIDIDGVVSDFTDAFKREVNNLYPDKIRLADDWQPNTWSWVDSGILTKEEENFVWKVIMHQYDFWIGIRPYQENVDALYKFLNDSQFFADEQVSVFYITSRATTSGMSVLKQTQLWLDSFQLRRSNTAVLPVIHANNSGGLPPKLAIVEALGIDAMIDDYTPTVVSLGEKGYLLDRPWNQDRPADTKVVGSLEEFLDKWRGARVRTAI